MSNPAQPGNDLPMDENHPLHRSTYASIHHRLLLALDELLKQCQSHHGIGNMEAHRRYWAVMAPLAAVCSGLMGGFFLALSFIDSQEWAWFTILGFLLGAVLGFAAAKGLKRLTLTDAESGELCGDYASLEKEGLVVVKKIMEVEVEGKSVLLWKQMERWKQENGGVLRRRDMNLLERWRILVADLEKTRKALDAEIEVYEALHDKASERLRP